MTPEEALRHEWIHCGQKTGDLRHSQSEASVSREAHSTSSDTSSSGCSNYTRLHFKCTTAKLTDKAKVKTVDTRITDCTSFDKNLNDSVTYLPPIV